MLEEMNDRKEINKPDHTNLSKEEMYEMYEDMEEQPSTYTRDGTKFPTKGFRQWKDTYILGLEDDKTPEYITISDYCKGHFDVICLEDSELLMIRDKNHYSFNLTPLTTCISKQITDMGVRGYKGVKANTFQRLKDTTIFSEDNFYFGTDYIPFENGFLNVKTNKVEPYKEDSKILFFYALPHEYKTDKEYDCPIFKEKLTEWVINDESKIIIDDIFEMIGYTMTADTGYKAIFLNHGDTNTGKTQLTNIIGFIVGDQNVKTTDLNKLQDRFEARFLQWKIMALASDMGSSVIYDNSMIKNMSGGDRVIRAEIKGGESFDFTPTAKFWCNVNIIPLIKAMNDLAFFERVIIIRFLRQYNVNMEGNVRNYYEAIINNPEEVQGIIHESIKGLKRLKERKDFRKEIREDTKHRWLMLSSEPYNFVYTCCEISKKVKVRRDNLWEAFNEEFGSSYGRTKFYETIEALGYRVKEVKEVNWSSGRKHSVYYFLGLKLKETKDIDDYGEGNEEPLSVEKLSFEGDGDNEEKKDFFTEIENKIENEMKNKEKVLNNIERLFKE